MSLKRLIQFFTSLRLTVACLALALVLVFIGTLAQVDEGLYAAQHRFFRSFFIWWSPGGASWKIPVFPGGYLLGGLLLINLVAAHIARFTLTRKKIGIFMVHAGLILLLLGQLLTDLLSHESVMHLREGETKNYSETERQTELAVIDVTESDRNKVVAVPQKLLARGGDLANPELPFAIRVKKFFPNSQLSEGAQGPSETPVTQGTGTQLSVKELPLTTTMDRRDVPSAIIELAGRESSLGTWLVSERLPETQTIRYDNRNYELALRPKRHYKPFSIHLLDFQHDLYKGTDIPKNFSSRIRLKWPDKGEDREVRIYMNNPLRCWGETYYQASFDRDDHGTVFQVVRNPAWLTPYFSCGLVGAGLTWQFLTHLFSFIKRRAK